MADPLEIIMTVQDMLQQTAVYYDEAGVHDRANGCRQARLLLQGITPEVTAALSLADHLAGDGLVQVGWTWRTPDGVDRLHPMRDTIPVDRAGALLKVYVKQADLDG